MKMWSRTIRKNIWKKFVNRGWSNRSVFPRALCFVQIIWNVSFLHLDHGCNLSSPFFFFPLSLDTRSVALWGEGVNWMRHFARVPKHFWTFPVLFNFMGGEWVREQILIRNIMLNFPHLCSILWMGDIRIGSEMQGDCGKISCSITAPPQKKWHFGVSSEKQRFANVAAAGICSLSALSGWTAQLFSKLVAQIGLETMVRRNFYWPVHGVHRFLGNPQLTTMVMQLGSQCCARVIVIFCLESNQKTSQVILVCVWSLLWMFTENGVGMHWPCGTGKLHDILQAYFAISRRRRTLTASALE